MPEAWYCAVRELLCIIKPIYFQIPPLNEIKRNFKNAAVTK